MRADPVRCNECGKFTIKFAGEGYDVTEAKNDKFILGRICKRCKILYIIPEFANYSVSYEELGVKAKK